MQNWIYPDFGDVPSRLRSKWIWCALALLATIGFVATVALERSVEIGRLSMPIWYDDVVYLFEAQSVLHDALHQSLAKTLHQLLDEHALIPVLLGCIGFLVKPDGLTGPYVADSVLLLVFLIGCIRQLRRMPTALIIGVVFAVGSIPLASLSVTEFRPDFGWGLITALAVIEAVSTNPFVCSRTKLVGLGLLTGLALISKPSAVPVTFAMVALALAGTIWIHWTEAPGAVPLRTRLNRLLLLLVPIVVIAGPVYIVVGAEIYHYIILGLVTLKDQNTTSGDMYFHLQYYSFGDGGHTALGSALPVCCAIWLAGLLFAPFYSRAMTTRFLLLLAVLAGSYIAPTQTPVKSVFFGSAFYALLVLSAVYVAARLAETAAGHWPRARFWPGFAATMFLAGGGVLLYANLIDHPTGLMEPTDARRQDLTEGTAKIWAMLKEHVLAARQAQPRDGASIVMVLAPEPITGGWISLYGVIENVPLRGAGAYYAATLDDANVILKSADYVVAGNSLQYQLYGPASATRFWPS